MLKFPFQCSYNYSYKGPCSYIHSPSLSCSHFPAHPRDFHHTAEAPHLQVQHTLMKTVCLRFLLFSVIMLLFDHLFTNTGLLQIYRSPTMHPLNVHMHCLLRMSSEKNSQVTEVYQCYQFR